MSQSASYAAILALVPSLGLAAVDCADEHNNLEMVNSSYSSAFDEFETETEEYRSGVGVSADVEVKWDDTEIIFDTPTVTVRDQRLVFGLPQMTMKTRELIFGIPSVRMKTVKTGQYPEFFCETHTVIPKCTVRWSNTYADIPETFLEEQRIKLDIPEFTFGDVEIVMGIPEFSMERQRWVLGLPQFTFRNVRVEATATEVPPEEDFPSEEELSSAEANFKDRLADLKSRQMESSLGAAHALYQCYRNDLDTQITATSAQYATSIDQLSAVIDSLVTRGVDVAEVSNSDGTISDLVERRSQLVSARDQALATLDAAREALDATERETLSKVN